MTNTKLARRYYAAQSPRGFSNEVNVYVFRSRVERDAWVCEHANDGDVNSAYCGAYAVTRAEAASIAGCAYDRRGFPVKGSVGGTWIIDGKVSHAVID